MKKYIFMAACTALLITLSNGASAELSGQQQTIAKAEAYLNGLKSLTADFTQTATGSQPLSGRFMLKRPGKLRFEYNDPSGDLIVADGSFIHYYDAAMEQHSSAPIKETLANFFLRDKIKISGDVAPSQVIETTDSIEISITKKTDSIAGTLTMYFSNNPVSLKKWKITDPQGTQTTITLKNIKNAKELKDDMFYYYDQKKKKSQYPK